MSADPQGTGLHPDAPAAATPGGPEPSPPEAAASGADPAEGEHEETREEHLLRLEEAVGESELARQINEGLRSLARAARSFLLYDPSNDAIKEFLDRFERDMLGAVQAVSQQTGEGLRLVVRPFELVWGGEVVYLERDRERSLAFRMFRDGVRRLDILPEVAWDELLSLLRILSIRYTGVRQQEEDIVTLLWKAGFKGIQIVAVEGFVPEDEELEDHELGAGTVAGQGTERGRAQRRGASFVDAPADFDLPIPEPLPPRKRRPFRVTPAELEALRIETTSRTLPDLCLALVQEMLQAVGDDQDPTEWRDAVHLVEEVRDFLLAEGQLASLTEMVGSLQALAARQPDQVQALLGGFVDARALRRIIHSIPATHTELPPELTRLLDELPGRHLADAIEVLSSERSTSARRIGRKLIERYARNDPDLVLQWIREGELGLASDLVLAFAEALPDRRSEVIDLAVDRGDPQLCLRALDLLEPMPDSDSVLQTLCGLLDDPVDEVRIRALQQITRRAPRQLYESLESRLVHKGNREMDRAEAEAYGEALVALHGTRAVAAMLEWLRPKSRLKRIFHDPLSHKWLRWAAVHGLRDIPGAHIGEAIDWLSDRVAEDLSNHCRKTMAHRRLEGLNG